MPSYRSRELPPPGAQLTVEVRGRGGERLLVQGVVDSVPWGYANVAARVVLRDAVARPMRDDE